MVIFELILVICIQTCFDTSVFDVAYKFDMFNDECNDQLFTFDILELPVEDFIIFNNIVDVELKLLIDHIELVDILFTQTSFNTEKA